MNTTPSSRLVLAGGSGFLGQLLAQYFGERGWEVVVLTRTPRLAASTATASTRAGAREVFWDGRTEGAWCSELEEAAALVNLAGVSVNCRYHARNRRRLMDSRIEPTRILGQAVARCQRPPRVWLNASTATIYRHTFGPAWTEAGEIGAHPDAKDAFSIEIATAWEREFVSAGALTPQTRKIALRSAMVLGSGKNSVFPVLRRLVRWGLGGAMGDGKQYVSWIHQLDFCRAVEWLITHSALAGVVNLAGPHPVTNREMMATLRQLGRRPVGLPASRWMLEVGAFFLRTETELIIKSRRVIAERLMKDGFQFRYRTMEQAFQDLMMSETTCP